jgi:hypothetical protein
MPRPDKKREVFICQKVAEVVNTRLGTDYCARPCEPEPPDVLLVSQSEEYATREAEVVRAPQDFTIRSDNQNLRTFDHELQAKLNRRGISGCLIDVGWTGDALRYGIKDWKSTIAELAGLIAERVSSDGKATGRVQISKPELHDPDVYRAVDDVAIFLVPQAVLQVESGRGLWSPSDGRWIEEAVRHKSRKYDVQLMSKWILVIDGFPCVDDQQVEASRATPAITKLQFSETWIVTVSGVHQLKSG